MRVRTACLLLALITALSSCGHFRREDGPLSRHDRNRGPLVLDGPDRVNQPRRHDSDKPSLIARTLPWNWF